MCNGETWSEPSESFVHLEAEDCTVRPWRGPRAPRLVPAAGCQGEELTLNFKAPDGEDTSVGMWSGPRPERADEAGQP
jgi:hypothetical protein